MYLTLSPCSLREPELRLINLSISSSARSRLEKVSVGVRVLEQIESITCRDEQATFSFRATYYLQAQLQYFCMFLEGASSGSSSLGIGYPISQANDNIYKYAEVIQSILYHQIKGPLPTMISLKRQCPYLKSNTIVIDEDSDVPVSRMARKKHKATSQIDLDSSPYDAIPEVPNIHLTVQQMKSDPLILIKQLESAYSDFGAVKLTVSQAWNSPFTFGNVDRPITVRIQTLQQLKQGKPFEQKVQSMRLAEFKEKALNFSKNYKFKTSPQGSSLESKRQHEYWNLVTKKAYQADEVTTEYAADLPSSLYGSGFPTRKIHNWVDADFEYEKNLFNLNNISRSPNSLLRVVETKKDKVSGITLPWMYVGMQFATFCWHVQDLFLHSVNYNHLGETKTWYVVPGKQKEDFDLYVKNHYETARKKNLLEKIILMIDPLELIKAGIKVYKVHQRPRDYVFTFLKAYHCGFSHGFNITEAVNFAAYDDIDCIKESLRFYEEQELSQNKKLKSHVLSYEWMIYETINQSILHSEHPQFQKVMKEYRRILNREYVLIKGTLDRYGKYADVRMISSKKRYYSNMCSYCRNYLYLSSLECSKCHKNLCERHLSKCDCSPKSYILNIRQLNRDRALLKEVVPLIQARTSQLK